MDKLKLVDKLREKANISYEEAKGALEKNNWDILDAMLYLERHGRVKNPKISVFYTTEKQENEKSNFEVISIEKDENKYDYKNKSVGIFEVICRFIDTCNNIFLKIRRKEEVLLTLPFTVVIVLLFFAFWIIIPLIVAGLFFNIEYEVTTKKFNSKNIDKANKVFTKLKQVASDIKSKFRRSFNR